MGENLDTMLHNVEFWHALLDYVAFGPHGPRTPVNGPGHNGKVFAGVMGVLAGSAALFYVIRANGGKCTSFFFIRRAWVLEDVWNWWFFCFSMTPPGEKPHTMTPEWQEQTNEYLKSQKSNPITGISSEGYKGKGYLDC